MSSIALWPSCATAQPDRVTDNTAPSVSPNKQSKSKHGAFKIWHRNVEPSLREAYNSVYGLSLYGSLTFATLRAANSFVLIQSEMRERFLGPAIVSVSLCVNGDHANVMKVSATSAGKDDGDLASIILDDKEVALNLRGVNIVVVNAETGELHSSHCFDTHGSPSESQLLARFVRQTASNLIGSVIIGAIRDDGAKFLTEEGRQAIAQLGVQLPEADNSERLSRVLHYLPIHRCQVLLTVCAKANAARCARLLLEAGWPVSYRATHTLNTPLHDAAYQCNTEVAEVLIAHGACQTATNRWGESPNDIASTRHSFRCLDDMILEGSLSIQSVIRFLAL